MSWTTDPGRSRRRMHGGGAHKNQLGQVLPIVGLLLIFLVGVAGLAVDAGHNYLDRRSAQNATDASALAAAETIASTGAVLGTPPAGTDKWVKAAHDFAGNNGYGTTFPNTACNVSTSKSFTATWFDSGYATPSSCSATTGFTTKVVFNDPPCGLPITVNGSTSTPFPYTATNCAGLDTAQALPTSACTTTPWNCMQVTITTRTTNFIMRVFGQPYTYTTTAAATYAQPPGPNNAQPPPSAVYLYELQDGCAAASQCFNESLAPTRSLLGLGSATQNSPTLWVVSGTKPQFYGYNGAKLSPPTHLPVVQSNGDVVLDDDTTFCDPYSTTTTVNCSNTNAVGTEGLSINPSQVSHQAHFYCHGLGASPATYGGNMSCTNNQSWKSFADHNFNGEETAFVTQNPWTATVDTSKLDDCGSLILDGQAVASGSGLNAVCAPGAGDEYTILPGKYKWIVINHGTYNFEAGTYDITSTAPVNTDSNTADYANGIDHSAENTGSSYPYAHDFDLCNGGQVTSCGGLASDAGRCQLVNSVYQGTNCLTAGVWIGGKGKMNKYAAGAASASSCTTGGSVGKQGGGGDATNVSGSGVTFVLDTGSGGFVSTSEVTSITLSSPGVGASADISNGSPLLFDLENGSFIHLDSASAAHNTMTGIIYQNPTMTSGGVEFDPHMNSSNSAGQDAAVMGQILAYSLTIFGTSGQAVDFQNAYGTSNLPVITNSGHQEASIVSSVTLASDASGQNAVFTLNYSDEWAMDGYDTYVIVGSYKPVFFSQGIWSTATPSAQPPNPNGSFPSDATGAEARPVNATSGSYPTNNTGSPAGSYSQYTTKSDPITGKWTDYTISLPFQGGGTATFETSGDWMWGHEKDFGTGSLDNPNLATVVYTFPVANFGNTVSISMGLYDGDHCGDYTVYHGTFNTPGQPGGGTQANGTVVLEQ